jgi:hypothetical protein
MGIHNRYFEFRLGGIVRYINKEGLLVEGWKGVEVGNLFPISSVGFNPGVDHYPVYIKLGTQSYGLYAYRFELVVRKFRYGAILCLNPET